VGEIDLSELERAPAEAIDRAASGERVVVVRDGRAAAVIMSADDAEDFALANAPEFADMRTGGRRAYERGETVPLDD
jgi:prevent-host-death family protein